MQSVSNCSPVTMGKEFFCTSVIELPGLEGKEALSDAVPGSLLSLSQKKLSKKSLNTDNRRQDPQFDISQRSKLSKGQNK